MSGVATKKVTLGGELVVVTASAADTVSKVSNNNAQRIITNNLLFKSLVKWSTTGSGTIIRTAELILAKSI